MISHWILLQGEILGIPAFLYTKGSEAALYVLYFRLLRYHRFLDLFYYTVEDILYSFWEFWWAILKIGRILLTFVGSSGCIIARRMENKLSITKGDFHLMSQQAWTNPIILVSINAERNLIFIGESYLYLGIFRCLAEEYLVLWYILHGLQQISESPPSLFVLVSWTRNLDYYVLKPYRLSWWI